MTAAAGRHYFLVDETLLFGFACLVAATIWLLLFGWSLARKRPNLNYAVLAWGCLSTSRIFLALGIAL